MKKSSTKLIVLLAVAVIIVVAAVAAILLNNGDSRFNNHLKVGNKYLDSLDFDAALAEFDDAIKIDPKQVDGYIGKIAALLGISDNTDDADLSFENAINAFITLRNGIKNTEDESAFDKSYTDVINKVYASASKVKDSGVKDVNKNLADLIDSVSKDNKAELNKIIDDLGDIVYPSDKNQSGSDGSANKDGNGNNSNNDSNAGEDNNQNGEAGNDSSGDGTSSGANSSDWVVDYNEIRCFGLSALDISNMSAGEFESYVMGLGLGLNEFQDHYGERPDGPDLGNYNYTNGTITFGRRYTDEGFGLSVAPGNMALVDMGREVDPSTWTTSTKGEVWFCAEGYDSHGQYISLPADFPDIHMSVSDKKQWFTDKGVTDIMDFPAGAGEGFTILIPEEYTSGGVRGSLLFRYDDMFGQSVMVAFY